MNNNNLATSENAKSDKKQVDLRAIVVRWAYNLFDKDRTWKQRKLKLKDLEFDINWSRVKFVDSEPQYKNIKKEDDPLAPPKHNVKVLFETQFENRTSQPQNYSFKTERTTSSTCSVEVENGVTMGYEASLTLQTPCEVLSVSGGFKREVTVNTTESETVVDEMTWGVDSQINVKSKHKTKARLVVDEVCEKNTYTIHTDVYGHVKVDILKKKDNSHVTHVGASIVDVIESTMNSAEKKVLSVEKKPKGYTHPIVCYESKGTATFKFGSKQHVDLDEEPLDPPAKKD